MARPLEGADLNKSSFSFDESASYDFASPSSAKKKEFEEHRLRTPRRLRSRKLTVRGGAPPTSVQPSPSAFAFDFSSMKTPPSTVGFTFVSHAIAEVSVPSLEDPLEKIGLPVEVANIQTETEREKEQEVPVQSPAKEKKRERESFAPSEGTPKTHKRRRIGHESRSRRTSIAPVPAPSEPEAEAVPPSPRCVEETNEVSATSTEGFLVHLDGGQSSRSLYVPDLTLRKVLAKICTQRDMELSKMEVLSNGGVVIEDYDVPLSHLGFREISMLTKEAPVQRTYQKRDLGKKGRRRSSLSQVAASPVRKLRKLALNMRGGDDGEEADAAEEQDVSLKRLAEWTLFEHDASEQRAFLCLLPMLSVTPLDFSLALTRVFFEGSTGCTSLDTERLFVIGLVSKWLEDHWDRDFAKDEGAPENALTGMRVIQDLIEKVHAHGKAGAGEELQRVWDTKRGIIPEKRSYGSKEIYRTMDKIGQSTLDRLVGFDDAAIAEQICIFDRHLYDALPLTLVSDVALWSKGTSGVDEAVPIDRLIQRFNDLSMWVSTEVCFAQTLKEKKAKFKRLLSIADHLLEMNDFHAVMALTGGFESVWVSRLTDLQKSLSSKTKSILTKLVAFCSADSNYSSYRSRLRTCEAPAIPHVGLVMKDLIMLSEGGFRDEKKNFSFSKVRTLQSILSHLEYLRSEPLGLVKLPSLEATLRRLYVRGEDELYDVTSSAQRKADD